MSWSDLDLSIITLVGQVNRMKGLGSRGDNWGLLSNTSQSCWQLGLRSEQWGWRTWLDSEIACCLSHSALLLEIKIVWVVCVPACVLVGCVGGVCMSVCACGICVVYIVCVCVVCTVCGMCVLCALCV